MRWDEQNCKDNGENAILLNNIQTEGYVGLVTWKTWKSVTANTRGHSKRMSLETTTSHKDVTIFSHRLLLSWRLQVLTRRHIFFLHSFLTPTVKRLYSWDRDVLCHGFTVAWLYLQLSAQYIQLQHVNTVINITLAQRMNYKFLQIHHQWKSNPAGYWWVGIVNNTDFPLAINANTRSMASTPALGLTGRINENFYLAYFCFCCRF